MEHTDKLLQLLNSTDEKSVAVGLEILKGRSGFDQYLADYATLYECFLGVRPVPLTAAHLVIFNQPALRRFGHQVVLPPEIVRLQKLQSLTLYNTDIQALPSEIGQLTQLNELKLNFNALQQIPSEISDLAQLQILWLHHNQLVQLPKSIGKLQALQELDLSANQLQTLPEEVGQLHQLKELSLEGNQLTRLPSSIGHLPHLHQLYLSRNPLPLDTIEQLRKALPGCEVFF
ncbi:leucine-rich repeat domain-containing protein [Microscilla marina]|uniref:Leucine-rich repeat containing protein n=1 Tax=Microscilla marina ATCC 23134 TaxID=313606 RepID=A1ZF46_MICM2|nr:leucine-rich repeat domain-containing protein [Microscilla marina]EAY31148.1 leucine-rich repeat containing protein [Microscilla marina ATCC 23134]